MPRQARIDLAGCLYHVMSRGIERGRIFREEADYKDFLARLKDALEKTKGKCLAWCLMPNHFHLLILRGERSLSELMRHLMTGYSVGYNHKYKRVGHLFQNRYKAILCEHETYLLELLAYIHLNPLRAGIAPDFGALAQYPWCGHAELLSDTTNALLDRWYILEHFGLIEIEAQANYQQFVKDRVQKYKKGEYCGGGLIKSRGDNIKVLTKIKPGDKELYDERILGSAGFIEQILKTVEEPAIRKESLQEIYSEIEVLTGVKCAEIKSSTQERRVVKARSMFCYMAKTKGGFSGAVLARELKKTSGGISQLIAKGHLLCKI